MHLASKKRTSLVAALQLYMRLQQMQQYLLGWPRQGRKNPRPKQIFLVWKFATEKISPTQCTFSLHSICKRPKFKQGQTYTRFCSQKKICLLTVRTYALITNGQMQRMFLAAISLDIQTGAEVTPKARNVAKCGAVKSYPSLAVVIPHVCRCCCSSTNRNEV